MMVKWYLNITGYIDSISVHFLYWRDISKAISDFLEIKRKLTTIQAPHLNASSKAI